MYMANPLKLIQKMLEENYTQYIEKKLLTKPGLVDKVSNYMKQLF